MGDPEQQHAPEAVRIVHRIELQATTPAGVGAAFVPHLAMGCSLGHSDVCVIASSCRYDGARNEVIEHPSSHYRDHQHTVDHS